jgi:hypothetical protein
MTVESLSDWVLRDRQWVAGVGASSNGAWKVFWMNLDPAHLVRSPMLRSSEW